MGIIQYTNITCLYNIIFQIVTDIYGGEMLFMYVPTFSSINVCKYTVKMGWVYMYIIYMVLLPLNCHVVVETRFQEPMVFFRLLQVEVSYHPILLLVFQESTLPETNIAPENRPSQRNFIFQPSIFSCYVSFRECKSK